MSLKRLSLLITCLVVLFSSFAEAADKVTVGTNEELINALNQTKAMDITTQTDSKLSLAGNILLSSEVYSGPWLPVKHLFIGDRSIVTIENNATLTVQGPDSGRKSSLYISTTSGSNHFLGINGRLVVDNHGVVEFGRQGSLKIGHYGMVFVKTLGYLHIYDNPFDITSTGYIVLEKGSFLTYQSWRRNGSTWVFSGTKFIDSGVTYNPEYGTKGNVHDANEQADSKYLTAGTYKFDASRSAFVKISSSTDGTVLPDDPLPTPPVTDAEGPGEVLAVIKPSTAGTVLGERTTMSIAKDVAYQSNVELYKSQRVFGDIRVKTVYDGLSRNGGYAFALFGSDRLGNDTLESRLVTDNNNVIGSMPDVEVSAASTTPNDYFFNEGDLWGLEMIGAPTAWEITTGDPDISVAVIDSGIADNHPDLDANMEHKYGLNCTDDGKSVNDTNDENRHGTGVAGIIGAVANNGLDVSNVNYHSSENQSKGIVGVNWRTNLIPIKALDSNGNGRLSYVTQGLSHVLNLLDNKVKNINDVPNIAAVNISIGYWQKDNSETRGCADIFKAVSQHKRAPLLVVSAGNQNRQVGAPAQTSIVAEQDQKKVDIGTRIYPASFSGLKGNDNMVVVGAVTQSFDDNDAHAAKYSNWSEEMVHLVAPGGYPPFLINTTGLSLPLEGQGTSLAAPFVAGAAALLQAKYKQELGYTLTATQIRNILFDTADRAQNPDNAEGAAEVNATPQRDVRGNNINSYRMSKYGLLRLDRAMVHDNIVGITFDAPSGMRVGDQRTVLMRANPTHAAFTALRDNIQWEISDNEVADLFVTPTTPIVAIKAKKEGAFTLTCRVKTFNHASNKEEVFTESKEIRVYPKDATAISSSIKAAGSTFNTNVYGHWRGDDKAGTFDRHSYSDWTHSADRHSRVCTVCSYVDEGAHDYVVRHNETNHWDECSTCGFNGQPHAVSHVWGQTLRANAESHWYGCELDNCSARHQASVHIFTNDDPTCKTCNVSAMHSTHTPEADVYGQPAWFFDAAQHWNVCAEGGERINVSNHSPETSWESYGDSHWRNCSVCNGRASESKHDYGEWQSDDLEHWKVCRICNDELALAGPHLDDDGNALCDSCGYSLYTLNAAYQIVCGDDQTWNAGSDQGLFFLTSIPYDEFKSLLIDGAQIASMNYSIEFNDSPHDGQSIKTIHSDYLENLDGGSHSVTFVGDKGAVRGAFFVSKERIDVDPTAMNGSGSCATASGALGVFLAMFAMLNRSSKKRG